MSYRDRLNAAWYELEANGVYQQVERIVYGIQKAAEYGNLPIFVLGNGGSQATAAHLVLHIRDVKIPAIDALADNAHLSRMANDFTYETQPAMTRDLVWPKASVFVISGSGNSKNVLNLIKGSRPRAFGLLGNKGGKALTKVDDAIVLSTDDYSIIEDIHLSLVHMISEGLRGRS